MWDKGERKVSIRMYYQVPAADNGNSVSEIQGRLGT